MLGGTGEIAINESTVNHRPAAAPATDGAGLRSLLRVVNEQVTRIGASADGLLDDFDCVCECTDPKCFAALRIQRADYTRIAGTPGRFVVATGHLLPDERVVERGGTYVVVTRGPAAA